MHEAGPANAEGNAHLCGFTAQAVPALRQRRLAVALVALEELYRVQLGALGAEALQEALVRNEHSGLVGLADAAAAVVALLFLEARAAAFDLAGRAGLPGRRHGCEFGAVERPGARRL